MADLYFVRTETDFTKTEQKLINYIITNPGAFMQMTISEAARAVGTSEPTVSRFARHCGYEDFKELRNTVSQHYNEENSPAGKLSSTIENLSPDSPEGFLRNQQLCLEKTISFMDPRQLELAVSTILQAENIYLYAKGAALSMAQLLSFRLSRFGMRITILPPGSSELFEYMNFFTEKDLVILFGFQKTPKEAEVLLDYQKQIPYKVIFFTSRMYQPQDGSSIIPLYVYRGEPSEYHSMAAPAALLDALVVMIGAKLGSRSRESLDRLYHLKEHYRLEIPR
ncbi:MAG TPA: MurR/RpiR family transcriptional regulator [Candidatus Mediterraneibacter stercoripullorum]|nr:MurR/RpiR family transcriptional regulator [Candidatus Mediterraneibacter stercoripullorum]